MQRTLFFSLILIVWLWLDFNGLMMSALATYFFFGMWGTPLYELKVSLVVLMTVSGPVVYWLFLMRRNARWELEILACLQLAAYLFCMYFPDSDAFAWGTVFGRLVSGVAVVSLLRRLRDFSHHEIPTLGILLGFMFYLWARILNDGLMSAIHPTGLSVAAFVGLLVLAAVHRSGTMASPAHPERPALSLQVYTIAFALLIDVGVALLYNFNLWSARTPAVHASVYTYSFGLGTAAGFLVARYFASRRSQLPLLLASGAAGVGFALCVVLHLSYGIALGLLAHGVGCFGLTVFWYLFVRRFKYHLDRKPGGLPIAGMQASNLISLAVLTLFLLTANPKGFWVAFGIGVPLLCAVEVRLPIGARTPVPIRRAYAWLLLFLVPMVPALVYVTSDSEMMNPTNSAPELRVMTTNARYGWTDDCRFEPDLHLDWLIEHPAEIVGMQEVNKGNYYGGFTDLFQYYRTRMPGHAIYGDAHFGFGNALFTSLAIRDSRVTRFRDCAMIRRSFIWALLEYRGREIEVFVAHVSHHPHPNIIRQAQMAQLIERLRRSERPWILMGDLNAEPNDPEITALRKVAHPVFRQRAELYAELTHPSANPRIRLDYVFFSDQFELVDYTVLDNRGTSDHRPVRCVLRLVR